MTGITAVYPQGLEQWVPFSRWFVNVQIDEWTKASRESSKMVIEIFHFYLSNFFFHCISVIQHNILYGGEKNPNPQVYEMPPRSQTLLVPILRTWHLRGDLNLFTYKRRNSLQLRFCTSENQLFMGCHSCNSERNFIISFGHISQMLILSEMP